MRFAGVIFDLDGTLIASESTYLRAWRLAAAAQGLALDDVLYARMMGYNREDTIQRLGEHWGDRRRAEDFVDDSQAHYDRLVADEGHRLREGVGDLLDHLSVRGTPLAVATSSPRRLAEATLADTGLAGYFQALVAGDEVREGKPAPEIYLKATAWLGLEPGACAAFEDSLVGARAALAAGLTVAWVPELAWAASPPSGRVHSFPDHRAAREWFR
jgi:HAD superfamily hydrolase (TIGR01509 family)